MKAHLHRARQTVVQAQLLRARRARPRRKVRQEVRQVETRILVVRNRLNRPQNLHKVRKFARAVREKWRQM